MSEPAVVKHSINTETGFTEGQATALRHVFSEFYAEIAELQDKVEFLEGELEVH